MNSFDYIWDLLSPKAQYANRRRACYRLWQEVPLEEQRRIYTSIRRKKENGEFVDYNPYYALDKAIHLHHPALQQQVSRPQEQIFLHGKALYDAMQAGETLVQVDVPERQEGRFPICSKADAESYGLKIVKDWMNS